MGLGKKHGFYCAFHGKLVEGFKISSGLCVID